MAFSEDDIKKMTAAQKQTYAIEQKITAEKDKQKQIANDAITSEEKKKLKLSDQLKLNKAQVKAGNDYTKTLKQGEKSLSGILGSLLKGNVAQAAELAFSQKSLSTTIKRASANKRIKQDLSDHNDFSNLDVENKMKVLDLVNGINDGVYDNASAQAVLEDIGENQLSQNSDLAKDLMGFAVMGEEEIIQKEKVVKKQAAFNKLTGELGGMFAVLAGVAIKFSATIDKIGETFGSLTTMSPKLKNNLIGASVEATKLGGGIEDVASITNTLASNFGLSEESASKLSSKVFDTSKALGISGDEAANLFGSLMQTANLSAEQAELLAEGAFQLARQNGVAPSAVMKDIAGSTEEIASFTQDGGNNIAEAAVQARKMGLSLSTTAKIAEGLLDFESSISKEVEASVLIGKQLNFQKAREAALSGDIAKATQEVVKQVGSEADFNKLNVIQRKALADSIGVSVTEMSKLVGQSDKLSLSGALASGSFGDLLGKDALSSLSQATAQIKALGASVINDLGPALLSIVSFLSPIVSGFAKMVSSLSKMGALLPIITAALGGYAAKSMYSAYTSLAAGAMKLPPPFNIVALGVGLGALAGLMGQAKSVDDFKSGPGGITHMSGPAGAFSLNPRDSVLATTNPIPVNDLRSFPAGTQQVGGGNENNYTVFKSVIRGNDIHNFVSNGPTLANGTLGDLT